MKHATGIWSGDDWSGFWLFRIWWFWTKISLPGIYYQDQTLQMDIMLNIAFRWLVILRFWIEYHCQEFIAWIMHWKWYDANNDNDNDTSIIGNLMILNVKITLRLLSGSNIWCESDSDSASASDSVSGSDSDSSDASTISSFTILNWVSLSAHYLDQALEMGVVPVLLIAFWKLAMPWFWMRASDRMVL
jgi:hypothetical protein